MRRIRGMLVRCVLLVSIPMGCGTESDDPTKPAAETKSSRADVPEVLPKQSLPGAEELFAAHVDAVGGRDVIAGLRTLYFESSVDTGAQNIKAHAKTWWKQGQFFGEQEIPGFGVARSGYDGNVVWVDDPINGLRKLEGKEAEQIIREGAIFLVADWKQYFARAETVNVREVEGRTLYDVQLVSPLGDEVTMSFAADDKLLARMSFKQITPTGTVPVTAVFGDYRAVEGVKFAHRSTLEIALGTVSQTYDAIEVNPEVDPSRFAFPQRESAVPADPADAQDTPTQPPG